MRFQPSGELIPMETSNAMVLRRRPQYVSIPPSTPSDIGMVSDAGGDPLQIVLARGDPEPSLGVVNQELREIVQLRQEVHAGIIHSLRQSSVECGAMTK